ncbi:MAG: SRPBCC family protein [Pseudomonadota bacterium]
MTLASTLMIGAGVIALAAAAPLLLPSKVQIERSAIVQAAPAEILALAASNQGYQRFNPYLTADPELKIEPFGPASGLGSGFRFEGKDGTGTQTVSQVTDEMVVYDIDMGPMGQPVQRIRVRPVEGGTEVTWTLDADMGMNPIARVFGLFMDGMMGKTFIQGLNNLAEATA